MITAAGRLKPIIAWAQVTDQYAQIRVEDSTKDCEGFWLELTIPEADLKSLLAKIKQAKKDEAAENSHGEKLSEG